MIIIKKEDTDGLLQILSESKLQVKLRNKCTPNRNQRINRSRTETITIRQAIKIKDTITIIIMEMEMVIRIRHNLIRTIRCTMKTLNFIGMLVRAISICKTDI